MPAKPVVADVDNSKPVGGVTKMPAVKLPPDTLKLVVDEAVPAVVLNAANVPAEAIVGVGALTVLLAVAMLTVVAPVLVNAMLPE